MYQRSFFILVFFIQLFFGYAQDQLVSDSTKNKLVLKASGIGGDDFTQITFNPIATAGLDKEFDSFKFIISTSKRPSIFTYADTNKLSINQLPDTTMLDLAVFAGINGEYVVSVDQAINFDYVVLEDLILGSKTDLLEETYSFEYFTSDGNYPFKLYFKEWAIKPLEQGDIEMYFYLDKLIVSSRKQVEFARVTFYDMAGKAVLEFREREFFQLEKQVNISGGHYIVKLQSGDLVKSIKVFAL